MSEDLSFEEIKKEWHGTYKSYLIGFVISLLLTLTSFSLVVFKLLTKFNLMISIALLALIQAIFQLEYFLHLGEEDKPRWESVIFFLMIIILLIVAIGTLWIMFDLDERVMSHMKMEMKHD